MRLPTLVSAAVVVVIGASGLAFGQPASASGRTIVVPIPSAPYAASTYGHYGNLDDAISPETTSLAFALPTGEWQGHGISELTLTLIGRDGVALVSYAEVDDSTNSIVFTLPAGLADKPGKAPNTTGDYEFDIVGLASENQGEPPAGRGDGSDDYTLRLDGNVPVTSVLGAATLDDNTVTSVFNHAAYWATPSSAVKLNPGDSMRFVASKGLFAGSLTARVGTERGSLYSGLPIQATVDGSASRLVATIPTTADFSRFFSEPYSPLIPEVDVTATVGQNEISVSAPVMLPNPKPTLVSRLSGADRYETAVALSKKGFPISAPVVVVATGADFPDALAAGPVARVLHGPLLLTPRDKLPDSVQKEVRRLKPSKILLVGGEGAASDGVERQLRSLAPTVVRIAGSNRLQTARKLVSYAFSSANRVFVATAWDFPDALSAAAAANSKVAPVLLVDGRSAGPDAATTALLSRLQTINITIVGGPGAVSNALAEGLDSGHNVTRESGRDRYSTSVAVAAAEFPVSYNAFIATGSGFADALSQSSLAGTDVGPLFTSPSACLPASTKAEIDWLGVDNIVLIGGPGALSPAVAALTTC